MLDAVLSFREQLAERGIHLLVIPAPGKASIYPDKLTAHSEKAQKPLTTHTSRLIGRMRAGGIEVLDLFTIYADIRTTGAQAEELYLPRDTHWSPAGVRTAARKTAEKLTGLDWLQKGGKKYEIKKTPIERTGDVVRMMDVPMLNDYFPKRTVHCEQVVDGDTKEPYKDDPHSEILILGDSFLRIYERDTPGSAGFISHLARELSCPLTSIVSDGGASTLVRQELSRKPELLKNKKVVIWEFVERDIRFGMEGWQIVPVNFPPDKI